jgi:hypothetical protein
MQPRRMDPLLREMCKFYDQLWRSNNPGDAELMPKSVLTSAFLRAMSETGRARLVMGEDGRPIWKATEKLVRHLGPEAASLQPCPARDPCPSGNPPQSMD